MREKPVIVLIGPKFWLKEHLDISFGTIWDILCFEKIDSVLKQGNSLLITCFVLTQIQEMNDLAYVRRLKLRYSSVTTIWYGNSDDSQLILEAGKSGIDYIFQNNNFKEMLGLINNIIRFHCFKLDWNRIDIDLWALPSYLRRWIRYFEEHYCEISKISELATQLNMSHNSLCSYFRINNLISPKQLVLCMKLQYAEFLVNHSYSLKEVCQIVGICTPERLSKLLKHKKYILNKNQIPFKRE